MKSSLFKTLVAAASLAAHLCAQAEDIDLFISAPPSGSGVPNVLFILDNTGNWSTPFTQEMAALRDVFVNMPTKADGTAKFNVGIMMFAKGSVKGSYVRAAMRPMNTTNRALYATMIDNLASSTGTSGDGGNAAMYGYAMAEAYRYYMGQRAYVGANEPLRDFKWTAPDTSHTPALVPVARNDANQAVWALAGNAFANKTTNIYQKPDTVIDCSNNFIIFISNGKTDNSDKDSPDSPQCASDLESCTAQQLLALAGADAATLARLSISPAGEAISVGDEWAAFMRKSALGVRTFTIDVGTPDAAHTALLKSMANQSDGEYFAANAASGADIAGKVNQALTQIQAVNSVFASVSLPVSVNTEGLYRNQVFIGMFRPDSNASPRWFGNLKQYKLGFDTDNVLRLVYDDADTNPTVSTPAIDSGTGFITGCARSFWTPTVVDTYWASFPEQNCLTIANSAPSNFPDGNVVEKGAQGYKLRGSTARTVKTCSSDFDSCTSLVNFDNTNVSQADLGAASTTERDNWINWAKGLDVQNEDLDAVTTAEMRLSAHGDVVHSRPVAVNFGTDASPQVVVFYGANDGALRAINGNRGVAIGSVAAGGELWSFIPPEFFTNIKRLYVNSPQISFKGSTTTTPAPLPKPYGIDGPIVAIKGTTDTWLYATMRRGGRALYAFDIPNATPGSPTLKWKRGCANNFKDVRTGDAADRGTVDDVVADVCSTGTPNPGDWSGIGQTWAPPAVVRATGFNDGGSPAAPLPLLVMGGGYDTCQDADPNSGCSYNATSTSSKGNKIYVVDADTGSIQRTFNTDSSVVAELTVVPDDQGLAKFIYAADLGGNVYRISGADANSEIGSTAPGSWTLTKIAVLGGSGANNRKFMFKPDVVVNSAGGYSILLGSGDREKPLLGYTDAASVTNYFFMLRDKPTVSTWLTDENTTNGGTCGGNYLCLGSLQPIAWDAANPTSAELSAKKGWYLGLRPNEQVVTSGITVFDTVTFSSHRPYGSTPAEPQPDGQVFPACGSNLGTAKVYNVNFADAGALPGETRSAVIQGGGLPPSPVAGMVTLDNGSKVPFIIGGSPTSALEGGSPPAPFTPARPKRRTYWYIQK